MDIQELKKQLDYLEETKQLIKEQLVAKGQPVDENTTFREYVDNMNDLIDTTDANAETSDIATGKSGYVGGQKVDGNLRDIASGSASSFISTNFTVEDKPQFNLLDFTLPFTVDLIHRQGSNEQLNVMYGKITSAIELTADKIKAGETVLGINGKTSVVDTEDANAVAENIINGQTAYVNGEKVTGTMQIQTTWFVNNAKHLSSSHLGESYGLNKLSYNSPVAMPKTNSGEIYVTIPRETLASSLGITADVVKTGTFISGVTGTFTNDATAVASNIEIGKTAYVNGQKITGSLNVVDNQGHQVTNSDPTAVTLNWDMGSALLLETAYGPATPVIIKPNDNFSMAINKSTLASIINLTADKIKLGEIILGITGTYSGSAMKEYASVTDMNNDIANISDGELVKVVESGTTSYYIKEIIDNVPTMTKLVKESETMSPQEYSDANDIADEILGE